MKNFFKLREELSLHEDMALLKHHQSMMKRHATARDYHHARDDSGDHHQDASMAHHNAHGDHEHAVKMLKKHGKDHEQYKSAARDANSMSKSVKSDYGTQP